MAVTRLSDPTPRMTLSRALLSEALRLARSPLSAVHLVCGLAAGLACGEYFSVARWDPALGADAYAQFLGALMPLMSAIVCGLAVDEERAAGRLANFTAVPSRGRAVAAKLLALAALGAAALAVALGVFGAVLAVAGRLPLGPAPLAAAWAGIVLGSLPLYALWLCVALRLGRNAAIGAGAAGVLLAFFSVGGLAHGLMTGELTGALATPLSWVPLAWPARLGSLGVEAFIDAARAASPLLTTALAGLATLMWTVPGGARETGGPYMRDPRHPRHFTDEFKRQIVDLYNAGKPKREIMDEYDLGKSTVERWIKSINATGSPRAADNRTPEQNRILELERENRRLRMEVDVLKQAALIYARK